MAVASTDPLKHSPRDRLRASSRRVELVQRAHMHEIFDVVAGHVNAVAWVG